MCNNCNSHHNTSLGEKVEKMEKRVYESFYFNPKAIFVCSGVMLVTLVLLKANGILT